MSPSGPFCANSERNVISEMNILIVGSGLLGRKTAELLDAAGHTVAVLDESADNLSLLSPEFGGVTSVGFPMDVNSLRATGIEGCDAVAVTTPDDNLNITVGQIAKNFFGVPKVVARISDPQRENAFAGFGLQTVCPTNMAGEKLVSSLTSPWQSRQVSFGAATVALTVEPLEKRLAGHRLSELELPPETGVLGVVKEDGRFQLLELGGDPALEAGDSLVYSRKID